MHNSPPQMSNSYLIKGEGPNLSSRLFYETRLHYIANQSGSAKETVSTKTSKNIEMLVYFICMGTQHRALIGWINIKIEHNNGIYLLYQLLILSFQTKRLQNKKFLPAGSSWLFFTSPSQWIGKTSLRLVSY